jgi:hypothetical protein
LRLLLAPLQRQLLLARLGPLFRRLRLLVPSLRLLLLLQQ